MNGKSTAYRILLAQLLVTLVLAALLLGIQGGRFAAAALTGGLIGVISNAVFAWLALSGGVQPARQVMRQFYLAEVSKFIITVALFLLALNLFKTLFLPILLGYGLTLVVYWTVPLLMPATAPKAGAA
jgi:ATP synthase protein I